MSIQKPPSKPAASTTAPWSDAASLRRNNIDFLRFLLATLVIYAHSYAIPVGNDFTEPLYRFSSGQRTFGGIAVDFFFILSGFLITHSWLRSSSLRSFLWKRILRIYPAFIAASIFGIFLVVPLCSGDAWGAIRSVPMGRFLLGMVTLRGGGITSGFPNNPFVAVNGSLWSIRYEFWCYIGVAALGVTAFLSKRPWFVLTTFIFAVVGSTVYAALGLRVGGGFLGPALGSPTLWARLLPCYLAGMTFYLYRHRVPWHPLLFVIAVVALIVACRVPHGVTVASPIAGTYVLFGLAFAPWLRCRGFGQYGDFSYGLYVFAFPIQQGLVASLGAGVPTWSLFVYSFGLTLIVAIASWYCVERPFLRLKPKKGRGAPAAGLHAPQALHNGAESIPAPGGV